MIHSRQFIVAQTGSREAYAVPRAFHQQGQLARFYTDIWCRHGASLFNRLPAPWWGLSRRHHPDLPAAKVVGLTFSTGLFHLGEKLARRRHDTLAASYQHYIRASIHFATAVAAQLRRARLDAARHCFFGFSAASLEILQLTRQQGIPSVLDQLDPGRTDEIMVREECARWPGWEALPGEIPEEYYQRLIAEWRAADVVLVNSNFSSLAAQREGLDASRIIVVPLAYEPETQPPMRALNADRPLHILWLGQVVLRKGIPYLFEAAKVLPRLRFTIAGRIGISEQAIRTAPANLTVLGRVRRERALELMREADVFVLPTLSDGFALTQLEAMAQGLPVITTPNCGDVVTPGEDGYIVPMRDPAALAAAIGRLDDDRQLLAGMSHKAVETSRKFTLQRYARSVNEAVARLTGSSRTNG